MQNSRVTAAGSLTLKYADTSNTLFVVLPGFLRFKIFKAVLNHGVFFMLQVQLRYRRASVSHLKSYFQKVGSFGVQDWRWKFQNLLLQSLKSLCCLPKSVSALI